MDFENGPQEGSLWAIVPTVSSTKFSYAASENLGAVIMDFEDGGTTERMPLKRSVVKPTRVPRQR